MDYDNTGVGLAGGQEMGLEGIWCEKEKSHYEAKSPKMKARRGQEGLQWVWQMRDSSSQDPEF